MCVFLCSGAMHGCDAVRDTDGEAEGGIQRAGETVLPGWASLLHPLEALTQEREGQEWVCMLASARTHMQDSTHTFSFCHRLSLAPSLTHHCALIVHLYLTLKRDMTAVHLSSCIGKAGVNANSQEIEGIVAQLNTLNYTRQCYFCVSAQLIITKGYYLNSNLICWANTAVQSASQIVSILMTCC